MEYIIGLFSDQTETDQAVSALRRAGIADNEYDVKTHAEYTETFKGWLERIFGMPEPLSGMEAEGLPHDEARWYEDQIEGGRTMIVVRAARPSSDIVSILKSAGAQDIRRYAQRDRAWTRLTGP